MAWLAVSANLGFLGPLFLGASAARVQEWEFFFACPLHFLFSSYLPAEVTL